MIRIRSIIIVSSSCYSLSWELPDKNTGSGLIQLERNTLQRVLHIRRLQVNQETYAPKSLIGCLGCLFVPKLRSREAVFNDCINDNLVSDARRMICSSFIYHSLIHCSSYPITLTKSNYLFHTTRSNKACLGRLRTTSFCNEIEQGSDRHSILRFLSQHGLDPQRRLIHHYIPHRPN